jgi:hypothetical protein
MPKPTAGVRGPRGSCIADDGYSVPIASRADPVEPFRAISEARALRYRFGELDLHEAVDGALAAAIKLGLSDPDQIQMILTQAFAPVRPDLDPRPLPELISPIADGVPSAANLQRIYERVLDRQREQYGPPISTLRAAEYLIKQNDPERLRTWLAGRSLGEIEAIQHHIKTREAKQ